ncbi:Hypothetical protein FKW44_024702, partial [Caligus rogercresseyi]
MPNKQRERHFIITKEQIEQILDVDHSDEDLELDDEDLLFLEDHDEEEGEFIIEDACAQTYDPDDKRDGGSNFEKSIKDLKWKKIKHSEAPNIPDPVHTACGNCSIFRMRWIFPSPLQFLIELV